MESFIRRNLLIYMEIHPKNFMRKLLNLSLIGIIFLLSCGKGEVQQEATEWYTKLGFKEVMKQIKKDTQLLSRKLNGEEWDESKNLCTKIGNSFRKLDLENPDIPDEFSDFTQAFDKSMARLLQICEDKESKMVKIRLEAVKRSCRDCHIRFRKELDIFNEEYDHGVALERLYKDTDKDLP